MMDDSLQNDLQANAPEQLRRADGRTKAQSAHATVELMYFGFGRVTVRGPVSGLLYEFTRLDPVQPVQTRDAVSMLKTRLFRRIR